MSNHERTGRRTLVWSEWHRVNVPDDWPMIDIDGMPYCPRCCSPLYLVEVVAGNQDKATTVTKAAAQLMSVPVVLVRTYPPPTDIYANTRYPVPARIGGTPELVAFERDLRARHVCHI